MNKLKKISWLVVNLVALFFAYGATANQSYGDWEIEDGFAQFIIFMENEYNEKIVITCTSSLYLTAVHLPDYKIDERERQAVFFDYRVDNQSVILKGNKYSQTWLVPAVLFPDKENGLSGEIEQYQALFQQMLQAKQSLTVNLIDAKGHIYRSANFSVKGLPEALISLAKKCGTDFQTYSGIEINQSDNHNK